MSTNEDLTSDGYTPWSPSQIREERFSQPNRRNDGYKAREVDQFKERMAAEIEWHQHRIRDLTAQLNMARQAVELVGDPYQDVNEVALNITMNAQLEADAIIAAAETQADEIVHNATQWGRPITEATTVAATIEPPADEPDVPETEQQSAERVARQLPDRLDSWAEDGQTIVRDAQWLAQVAQASISRVTELTSSIVQQLSSGPLTDAHSVPSIPGAEGEPIPTPDPPTSLRRSTR